MREVLPELLQWWRAGDEVGVGTVVATFRSAPRPAGASMLVGPDDTAVGSVSGGCVEGAVYELGQEVVASGTPVLTRYGISDDDAFAVGLTCGGILDVYVEKVSRETFPELEDLAADLEAGRPVAVATVIEHPDPAWLGRRVIIHPDEPVVGSLGSPRADDAVHDDAMGLLASGTNATLTYGPDGERRGEGMRVFVWAFAPKPRMLVFGAIDFAAAVARVGSLPRLPRDRVRRAPRLRDHHPVPRGRRGRRRVAPPLPREAARRRRPRRPHRDHGAHPRPEVRRPAARGRAPAARGGLRRRHGLTAHPRGPRGPAPRGRPDRRRARRGCPARSASTSAPAPRRRRRSRSPPRSSPGAGAAPVAAWRPATAASTTTDEPSGRAGETPAGGPGRLPGARYRDQRHSSTSGLP